MSVTKVSTNDEFNHHLSENDLLFVDFYAEWCGPCKRIAPSVETLSHKYTSVKFLKVDVDDDHTLAEQYNVKAMPTFLFFKKGSYTSVVGADLNKIEYALKMLVGDDKPSHDF